jgi:hypothetical protein
VRILFCTQSHASSVGAGSARFPDCSVEHRRILAPSPLSPASPSDIKCRHPQAVTERKDENIGKPKLSTRA